MFRKTVGGFVALSLLMLSITSLAQQRIAVVNLQAAILSSEYGQAEMAKLEASSADANLITEFEGCLLYTSPSPRDATLSRMPSSA